MPMTYIDVGLVRVRVLGDALRHHRITKTLNYVLHIAATDTPCGRELASTLSSSLRLAE
jgi:hypothetical protein